MRISAYTAILTALVAADAGAQQFPSKPIRVVIPNPPGGSLDIVARLVGPKVTEMTGQSMIIDNRPGADTIIGTDMVARSPGDGYTVLFNTLPIVVNPAIQPKLPYDLMKDLAPVSLIASFPFVLVVNPTVPAKTVKELIALARAHPGQLNYSSAGNGSNLHVAAELFKNLTHTSMVHVLYKGGGPALLSVLAGETDLSYLNVAAVIPHVKAGKLRALGLTAAQRSPAMPDLPTIAESGVPGYDFTAWVGALVPASTPPATVNALSEIYVKAVRSFDLSKRFEEQGADIVGSTPAQFAAHLKSELARWAKVVKESGIKAD